MATLLFSRHLVLASLALLISARSGFADVVISSYPASFGIANVVDSGQTFTVPAGQTFLKSFNCMTGGAGGNITFNSSLYLFDNGTSKVVGAALYTSGTTNVPEVFPYTSVTFTPGSPIAVVPGATYLWTFRQGGFGNIGNLQWPYSHGYAEGEYRSTQGGAPYTTATWSKVSYDPPLDIGFSATFIPEPGSGLMLLVAGAACIMRKARTRRSRASGIFLIEASQ